MKKITMSVFAALIALALSMPAWAQGNTQAPANTSKSAPASKDEGKDKKTTKKTSKKKTKKTDTKTDNSNSTSTPAKK